MISQKKDPFISLLDKRDLPTVAESSKEESPRGPTVYISGIKLPVTDQDLNQTLVAEVKIKPRRISTTIEGNKSRTSYDLEITGIKFK